MDGMCDGEEKPQACSWSHTLSVDLFSAASLCRPLETMTDRVKGGGAVYHGVLGVRRILLPYAEIRAAAALTRFLADVHDHGTPSLAEGI